MTLAGVIFRSRKGFLHLCGHAHVRLHISPDMDCKRFAVEEDAFSLAQGFLHLCGHAHVRSHISPDMNCKRFAVEEDAFLN